MRRGSSRRRLAWAVLGLAALLACSAGDERLVAVARVGTPDGRPSQPRLEAADLTLEQATRRSLGDALAGGFEVAVEPRDRRLLFSLGRPASEGCEAPVAFSIAGRFGAGWRELFRQSVGPAEPGWIDRSLELDGERPQALRFAARVDDPGCASGPQARWGSLVFLGPALPTQARLPNLLLISLDTLGADYLGSFGNAADVSPNLDRFLADAFSFRRAYAQYGYTLPSHVSLFSGLQPVHHGVYLPDPGQHFDSRVGALARQGYATAAFTEGGMLSAAFGMAQGFDWYEEGPPDLAEQLAGGSARTFARAARWLEQAGPDLRFFLFVHTYEVHLPYLPRDAEARAVARRLAPPGGHPFGAPRQMLATTRHNRGLALMSPSDLEELRALHFGEIDFLDRQLEHLLERVAEAGLARDTLVVVTSDHGDQFGEHGKVSHGNSLHNRVLHVPLGFRWPGHIQPGSSDSPVQLVDVMPTIFELIGIEVPADLDGRSLVPLLRGEPLEERPAISEQRHGFGECARLGRPDRCRVDRYAIQTDRFKLIHLGEQQRDVLYDLAEDPLEERDVAAQHPELVRELRTEIDAHAAQAPAEPPPAPAPPPMPEKLKRLLEQLGYAR